jgi:hypothetical protein
MPPISIRFLRGACVALAASCVISCTASQCSPQIQAELGRGDEVDVYGAAWDQPLLACDDAASGSAQLHLLWRLDYWRGREPLPATRHVWDVSATPFVRWPVGSALSLDVGIGLHAISHTRIDAEREMSTAFQFGEFIGASMRLGAGGAYELGIRLQHVSNGGIKHPNDGITYPLLTLSRGF